ncbi:MAG: formamidopyrimidine-DNA glycosylase [Candidatus Poriferisodalaceae bacterium]|jgi:formamidopyrimidine-DNA glycosylase
MPELTEIEMYRRLAAPIVGRVVGVSEAPIAAYLKGGLNPGVLAGMKGRQVEDVRRIGKLLLIDLTEATLGLRFGMTGRLVIDGNAAIDELLYTTARPDPKYRRFAMELDDGVLEIMDPRRFGSVELNPDESILGPDALSITTEELVQALAGSRTALKARLLDQSRVAGIGNLLCDEILWRAGLTPTREAGSITDDAVADLAQEIRSTINDMLDLGGSHMGNLQDQRSTSGVCPNDGTPLARTSVGGRTTYWCPLHQG